MSMNHNLRQWQSSCIWRSDNHQKLTHCKGLLKSENTKTPINFPEESVRLFTSQHCTWYNHPSLQDVQQRGLGEMCKAAFPALYLLYITHLPRTHDT